MDLGSPTLSLSSIEVFADGLDHPECVTRGPDGSIFAGGEAGQVYRIDGVGHPVVVGTTEGFTLGLCVDGDNNIYTCDVDHRAVMRITPDGVVEQYSRGSEDDPFHAPNFPVFDDEGRMFVSDSGEFGASDGRLFVIERGGRTRLLTSETAAFPNGLAFDETGSYLYVVLSSTPAVVRVPIHRGHVAGPIEPVVELPGMVPDGLSFDAAGGLWITCYAPDAILRLDPDTGLEVFAHDPRRITLASPANMCFTGAESQTVVVANFAQRHLSKLISPVAGAPLRYPVGIA